MRGGDSCSALTSGGQAEVAAVDGGGEGRSSRGGLGCRGSRGWGLGQLWGPGLGPGLPAGGRASASCRDRAGGIQVTTQADRARVVRAAEGLESESREGRCHPLPR